LPFWPIKHSCPSGVKGGIRRFPVLLGDGVPFFDHVKNAPVLLDEPTIIQGSRVTHLHYVVRKP
jgi:hypothetical protein